MKIDRMVAIPSSRAAFERNLFLLRDTIIQGKFSIARGLQSPVDGLLRVRALPNGRIDLLSIDEGTRLMANMCADMQAVSSRKRPIQLSLETVSKTVMRGEVPKFQLTIRNIGDEADSIIDLTGGRRPDLQDTYYDLELMQGGKAVDLQRIISDPGPISGEDLVTLKPGEEMTFELSRFARALENLPPGHYRARVRFWQDPLQDSGTSFLSPAAEFVVQE